jgi:hypothetical protein
MSQSLRILKVAVREFVNRPAEEDIDPDELRHVVEALEGEFEKLLESPEECAAQDEAVKKAIEIIWATYGKRS